MLNLKCVTISVGYIQYPNISTTWSKDKVLDLMILLSDRAGEAEDGRPDLCTAGQGGGQDHLHGEILHFLEQTILSVFLLLIMVFDPLKSLDVPDMISSNLIS